MPLAFFALMSTSIFVRHLASSLGLGIAIRSSAFGLEDEAEPELGLGELEGDGSFGSRSFGSVHGDLGNDERRCAFDT